MDARSSLAGALIAIMALFALGTATATAATADTVHVRGTVYTFDNQEPIAGATVRIQELAGLAATSGPDGAYDLEVPDGTRITPYVEAAGHHGIHLQTFVTQGRDLERVNFQIPTTGTYGALAALLAVPLDANGDPAECVIVSTFSTVNVREASFDQFVAYGAHGVAGATASATPALAAPIYFNESVIPDPSRTESSDDGGVIWTGVPAGVYRLHASHPSTRFADFIATCEPGRLVNANPPQGFYELRPGEASDDAVDAAIAKAKVERRKHRRRRVKLSLDAGEYVVAGAKLTRAGKTIASSPAPAGAGAYGAGRRKLALKLKPKVDSGRATLTVSVEDALGNARSLTKKLKVPKPR